MSVLAIHPVLRVLVKMMMINLIFRSFSLSVLSKLFFPQQATVQKIQHLDIIMALGPSLRLLSHEFEL